MRDLSWPALVALLVGGTAAVVAVVVTIAAVVVVVGVEVDEAAPQAVPSSTAEEPDARPTHEPSPEPVDPEATEAPRPALEPYYTQDIDWHPCHGEYRCASMEVPLDYSEPAGKRIEIALLKVPAREPQKQVGTLVVNPGGPGAPGTDYAAHAGFVFGTPLLNRFDIVGFDPRGTGKSAPVNCLTDEQLDAYIAQDPSPDTRAERQQYQAWNQRIGRGCVQRSPGKLAAHVSTQETARDMDILRAVLGEEKLNYFGASYGTLLGATYADIFPENVGRFVLDGAVDPTLSNREMALQQAEGFQTALRAYVSHCVEGGDCYLGGTVEEGLQRISDFLASVDAQPLETREKRDLKIGNAFYGLVTPLYNRDYWPLLDRALQAAFHGDGTLLLELSDAYSSRGPDGYTNNMMEALYAISCLDDPSAIPPSQVPTVVDEFTEVSPTFGRVFAWSLTACNGVQVESDLPERTINAPGAPPILVIGTTRDPATPLKWAKALADQLSSGVLIVREGDGHTGYNQGNECVDDAVESYLIEGVVPDGPLRC